MTLEVKHLQDHDQLILDTTSCRLLRVDARQVPQGHLKMHIPVCAGSMITRGEHPSLSINTTC
jgi:hypothetical protein